MPVKMNPTSVIEAKLGLEPNGRVQSFFTETCYRYMDKYVPMRDGNLRTNVDIATDSITYESPYASYQYYGIRKDGTHEVKKYTTPGTGPYWDKIMWALHKSDIIKETEEYMKRGG